jgi:hypothetical protein
MEIGEFVWLGDKERKKKKKKKLFHPNSFLDELVFNLREINFLSLLTLNSLFFFQFLNVHTADLSSNVCLIILPNVLHGSTRGCGETQTNKHVKL